MGNINNALGGMKTIFQAIDPSPEDPLQNVWIFPAQRSSISLATLPVSILSWAISEPGAWLRNTMDSSQHRWNIEGLIFLNPGPITKDDQAEEAEAMALPWLQAVAVQFATPTAQRLAGNVVMVGNTNGQLFNYHIGEIHWWTKVFWGIRLVFPVSQTVSHS